MTTNTPDSNATNSSAKKPMLVRVLNYAFVALLVVSGSATFMGLYELMSAGSVGLSVSSVAYSAVVVIVLTMIMGFAAEVAVGSLRYGFGPTARFCAAAFYAALALFSISLAFAFWWSNMAASNATQTEMTRDVTRLESDLREARGSLSAASTQLALAAQLAANRSKEEDLHGGTCSPLTIESGYGPAAKTRAAHAAWLENVRSYTTTRLSQLDRDIGASTNLIGEVRHQRGRGNAASRVEKLMALHSALVSLSDQTRGLASDPGLASFRAEMRATAAAYRKQNGHANGINCLDTGMASAIEGTERSIAALRPVPPPTFGIYDGNKATMEAIGRFFRTTFWFLPHSGPGLAEIDELLAFAIGWIVDLGLFVVVALRSMIEGPTQRSQMLERARRKVAERHDSRAAGELLAMERAASMNQAMASLAACPDVPFADLLVEWRGLRHLVIPQFQPDEAAATQAKRMAAVLNALDQQPASGVREQLRLSGKRLFGLIDNDPRARQLLIEAGAPEWATGRNFRWFLVSNDGLHNLATWARTTQGITYSTAVADSCVAAMGKAIHEDVEIRSTMHAEEMQHRADVARANLHVERLRREAEIDAILAQAPLHPGSSASADKPMMFNG